MLNKIIIFVFFISVGFSCKAQVGDSIKIKTATVEVDSIPLVIPDNGIANGKAMTLFFQKLKNLQQSKIGKINIVHIGDSHIQADLLTGRVRKNLQSQFGNGGRGFVFPHKLAKTNGAWDIKFTSSNNWDSYKNVHQANGTKVGLSGIALFTKTNDFSIELTIKDPSNYFNTVKVVTPNNENVFSVAFDKKAIVKQVSLPSTNVYKVKRGDAISTIAKKFKISITDLKKKNNLKSNKINAGDDLIVGDGATQTLSVEHFEYEPIPMQNNETTHSYSSTTPLSKIDLVANDCNFYSEANLDGLILENNNPGILYHNIGVNGAKFSSYIKYPSFFEELKALSPDLLIISLGTNESYDKMDSESYMDQLKLFLQNVRNQNPKVEILVTTCQPSLFSDKSPNTLIEDYSYKVLDNAVPNNYAVWDMFAQLGGLQGLKRNLKKGFLAKDGVHYAIKAYEKQGDLLSEAIINEFQNHKN